LRFGGLVLTGKAAHSAVTAAQGRREAK